MDRLLAVGFGDVTVTCDGKEKYSEVSFCHKEKPLWEVEDAERLAAKDPDHDWRIHIQAPLYEAEYQRHGPERWVLVRKGSGFA